MKGSCLCGKVTYSVERLSSPIQHCSCRTCRKAHAAAFNTAAAVSREDFRWVSGEEVLRYFESSPGKLRYFCSNCGSHLMADKAQAPFLVLRVATLDDDPQITPQFQIWQSHEVPWLEYGKHIQAYDKWQPGRD